MIAKQRKKGMLRVLKETSGFQAIFQRFWGILGNCGESGGTVGVPTDFVAILEDYQVREVIHPCKELEFKK